MKKLSAIIFALFVCAGCMFVTETYSPEENGEGYTFSGSCVGYNWEKCRARAEALCADVGQKVAVIEHAGGPENKPGIAIVPKKIRVTCGEK